jgi:hypothetical protein
MTRKKSQVRALHHPLFPRTLGRAGMEKVRKDLHTLQTFPVRLMAGQQTLNL